MSRKGKNENVRMKVVYSCPNCKAVMHNAKKEGVTVCHSCGWREGAKRVDIDHWVCPKCNEENRSHAKVDIQNGRVECAYCGWSPPKSPNRVLSFFRRSYARASRLATILVILLLAFLLTSVVTVAMLTFTNM